MANNFDPYAEWLGIKDARRPLTNYQLLGLIPFESQAEKIEDHAQHQLAKLAQFSKGEQALLAKRIAFEIKSASTCLLNPATKATYDAGLRSRESPVLEGRPTSFVGAPTNHCGVPVRPPFVSPVQSPPAVDVDLRIAPSPVIPPLPKISVDDLRITDVHPITSFRKRGNNRQKWFVLGTVGVSTLIVAIVLAVHLGSSVKETAVERSVKSVSLPVPTSEDRKTEVSMQPKPVTIEYPVATRRSVPLVPAPKEKKAEPPTLQVVPKTPKKTRPPIASKKPITVHNDNEDFSMEVEIELPVTGRLKPAT